MTTRRKDGKQVHVTALRPLATGRHLGTCDGRYWATRGQDRALELMKRVCRSLR